MKWGTLAIALALSVSAAHAAEPPTLKKRIAVFEFADKTDESLTWWRSGQGVGEGMADLLVTALVKSGQYIVIEREKLNEVLSEQSLGASGAVNEESAATIGKVLGVEIAVFGAVTNFAVSESSRGGRAPVPTPLGRRRVGVRVSTAEARVTIDVRLVNTSTGEILAAEMVTGKEMKKGVSVRTARVAFKNEAEFDESLVGKATRKAMVAIVGKIGEQMKKVPWSGKIVKSEGGTAIINAGSSVGIGVGDTMEVYARGEELIDPDTGLKLGSEETKVGRIVVTSDIADGKASKCDVIEGSGGTRGDVVRYAQ
jgi:curli biogenesis system outer membrane secretion channel CsgG